MFHVTAFAGTTGDMIPAGFTALTVFGGAELRRPTLASLLLHEKRRRQRRPPSRWEKWLGGDESLVITLFGGTSLVSPTAAEEYAALTGMVRSGAMTAAECREFLDAMPELGARRSACRTLTVFGACVTTHPSPKRERKALDAAVETGSVTAAIRRELEALLDTPPDSRARLIGRIATTHV